MTEREYILVSDYQKIKSAKKILNDITPDELLIPQKELTKLFNLLEKCELSYSINLNITDIE